MNSQALMYRLGLTNWDGATLDELTSQPIKKPYGYCSSHRCHKEFGARKGTLKTTDSDHRNCPDCGYALYWEWK